MNDAQLWLFLKSMEIYGGGFVSALATAWFRADNENSAKLATAFPNLIVKYGPGSDYYARTQKEYSHE